MIQSMTGYGKGEAVVGGYSAAAEIRSVNSRFLEVNVKLPLNLSARELEVREIVRQAIYRGKISVSVSMSATREDDAISVDPESVKKVMQLLRSLKKYSRIPGPIRLEHLLNFSDVFKGTSAESATGEDWEAVKSAIDVALGRLKESRRAEGTSLSQDLSGRIRALESRLVKIEQLSHQHVEEEKSKLRRKVDEVLGDREIDPARIELEIVLLADKLDITEEIVRFRTHNRFFEELLSGEDSNGRRLNFLIQEMNREANTMGSKCFDAEMSHLVVEVKEELEKIREQVQNLE
jgi:uncharacterized protein (TIGR00255 family)